MATRYTYAHGYKSRDAAQDALEDCFATGEVSQCERPKIEAYQSRLNGRRYMITLEH